MGAHGTRHRRYAGLIAPSEKPANMNTIWRAAFSVSDKLSRATSSCFIGARGNETSSQQNVMWRHSGLSTFRD
jgi:hypothetical protein